MCSDWCSAKHSGDISVWQPVCIQWCIRQISVCPPRQLTNLPMPKEAYRSPTSTGPLPWDPLLPEEHLAPHKQGVLPTSSVWNRQRLWVRSPLQVSCNHDPPGSLRGLPCRREEPVRHPHQPSWSWPSSCSAMQTTYMRSSLHIDYNKMVSPQQYIW